MNHIQQDISFCGLLLRDLQHQEVPVSSIIRRLSTWPPVSRKPFLRKRLWCELHGFPREEEDWVTHLHRLVKRAGIWEPFFGPVEELEQFAHVKEPSIIHEESIPDSGGIMIGQFQPEFLDDEEELESTKAYLDKLRQFLAEVIVNHYFILTERFTKHFDWML